MRRFLMVLAAVTVLAVACAPEEDVDTGDTGSSAAPVDAATCTADADLVNEGTLTIATGNPAYKPWYGGESGGRLGVGVDRVHRRPRIRGGL